MSSDLVSVSNGAVANEAEIELGIVHEEPKSSPTGLRFDNAGLKEATLVWKKVDKCVDVDLQGAKSVKQLLHGVSGYAKPGEMTALMGPSGSGKTTLLNILGGRALDSVKGEVLINNVKFKKSMRRSIAYVLQEDLFYTQLTVLEQLTITSKLRLPDALTDEERKTAVDRVIKTLRIQKCLNTQIMLISGGEKKRCNIGTELLTNPSIMLLDEPTSGLDSNGASALIAVLKNMAHERMTIISSIHQPSSRVFYSFDRLLLLADGHVIYSGRPDKCLAYLATLNFIPPNDYNPADFLMDLVSSSAPDGGNGSSSSPSLTPPPTAVTNGAKEGVVEDENAARAVLIRAWNNDATYEEAQQACVGYSDAHANDAEDDESTVKYMASYRRQFFTLLGRARIVAKSNIVNNLQIFQSVGMGLICGGAWWQMEYSESTVNDRAGFIFFFGTFWFFMTLFQGMMQFLPERDIMLKERAGGSYHLSAYFLSKTMSETPVRLSLPLLYLAICFPMSGLSKSAATFFAVAGTQLLAALAGESIGLFIGTSTMDYEKAMVIATLISLALMLCGGYFVQNLPDFVQWIRYLSPFKYSYDACLQLSFDREIPCDGSGILPDCGGSTTATVSGQSAVSFLGATDSVGMNLAMLLIFITFFRISSYLCLRFVPHNNGRK